MAIKRKWWMRVLCAFGIHWAGRSDGGGMGDAYSCDVCGRDNYCPCVIVHDRAKGSEIEVMKNIGDLTALAPKKEEDCDHICFPVIQDGEPTGQECAICGKFNSVEELGMKK